MNKIFLNATGSTIYNGLQWLITVITARRNGLDESGILAVAMSFSLTLRAVAYFGVRNYLVSDVKNKYAYSDYTGLRIITCTASYTLCIIFMLTGNYKENEILCVLFYMIFRISESFSDLYEGIMQKCDRLDTVGIMMSIKGIITTLFFICGLFIFNSLAAGIFFMSISALIFTFVVEYFVAVKISESSLKPTFKNLRSLFSETVKVFICTLEISLIYNLPQIMLSKYPDEAGAYGSIFSLSIIFHAIFQYIYVPFTVKLSEIKDEKHEFNTLIFKILFSFCVILLIFMILGKFFGMNLIVMIYGDEIKEYEYMLLPSVLSAGAYSLMIFIGNIRVIERDFFSLILSHTIGAIICFVLGQILPDITPRGASYALIISTISVTIIMAVTRKKAQANDV